MFPRLSPIEVTEEVVSFQPTTTTLRSPAVSAAGYATDTFEAEDGVAEFTWRNEIETEGGAAGAATPVIVAMDGTPWLFTKNNM